MAQRLARRICPNCRQPVKISPETLEQVRNELSGVSPLTLQERVKGLKTLADINESLFFGGAGCVKCKNTGYGGRLAILEIIDVNQEIQGMILNSKKIIREEDVRASQEFLTIKEDGLIKVLQGLTTLEEIYRVIQD